LESQREKLSHDTGQGYYFFWALLGGALVLALGSSALLAKMDERPELANADPLLVTILKIARVLAWIGILILCAIFVLQTFQGSKESS
jgi:hypothetical protein